MEATEPRWWQRLARLVHVDWTTPLTKGRKTFYPWRITLGWALAGVAVTGWDQWSQGQPQPQMRIISR